MLEDLGATVTIVRRESDLLGPDGPRLDALILPGGESSTQDRLLRLLDLVDPLKSTILAGVPTLGTCAGLILLADSVRDPAPGQQSLGLLDVAVRRNAFGAQLVSTEATFSVDATGLAQGEVRGALIRAPEIVSIGSGARELVNYRGHILGATSSETDPSGVDESTGPGPQRALGSVTGISFHPELSGDPTLHRALLALP